MRQFFAMHIVSVFFSAMNDCRKDYTKQISAYSPRCRMGTLLPDFPSCADIKLPPNVPEEKVVLSSLYSTCIPYCV